MKVFFHTFYLQNVILKMQIGNFLKQNNKANFGVENVAKNLRGKELELELALRLPGTLYDLMY